VPRSSTGKDVHAQRAKEVVEKLLLIYGSQSEIKISRSPQMSSVIPETLRDWDEQKARLGEKEE